MLMRRSLLAGLTATVALRSAHAERSFSGFLASVWGEARLAGVRPRTLDAALSGLAVNARVLELDRRQPEFTMTWQRYRVSRVSPTRVAAGRRALAQNRAMIDAIAARYGVDPGVLIGIWGLESNYGADSGGFGVVEALATLAWEGRRARFFRSELVLALEILDHGDVALSRMRGSYAGAMGQPQFMPSSYLRYAVDYSGTGRRDIWDDTADVLASIANYLARSGWRPGEGWGLAVRLPPGLDAARLAGTRRSLGAWAELGVVTGTGRKPAPAGAEASLLLPDGPRGEAFLTLANFAAIRRYNPSDFYALAVGLIGAEAGA